MHSIPPPVPGLARNWRILLAEDHAIVRQGLQALLSCEPAFSIVGETGDGAAVLGMVASLRPDLLILDLELPGRSGFAILEELKAAADRLPVLVLTGSVREGSVRQALAAGADGYVPKSDDTAELLVAINAVLAGRKYVSKHIAQLFGGAAKGAAIALGPVLTARQREIVCLVAAGCSNEQIAAKLGISLFTVRTHRQHFMRAFELHNAAEITAFAIQKGFYEPV
jgi:DNA-binding NarL/FixJ family response regulator